MEPLCDSARHAVVIGSGPAGLMAAERLAEAGVAVTVIERMPSLGRRLLMAGRGGLNITHTEAFPAFITHYGPDAEWIAPYLDRFGPQAVRNWCAELGIETFAGSSGRVFPVQMKASPLLRAWVARLERLGVTFRLRCDWLGMAKAGVRVSGDEVIDADAVVLACGGATWPRLGANGDWVPRLGQPVTPLAPANGGFTVAWSENFRERFAGHPIKGVALRVGEAVSRAEAVVTAEGVEGGGVYALSRSLRDKLASGFATLTLDLAPDVEADRVAARLAKMRAGLSLSNRLRRLGLSRLKAGLLREGFGGAVAREPAALAAQIKAAPVTITGTTGMEKAISTAGGLPLCALDDRLMVKALPGVFACGEMLDWEAPTGGYLLTACLATGHAAGLGAGSWLQAGGRLGSLNEPRGLTVERGGQGA